MTLRIVPLCMQTYLTVLNIIKRANHILLLFVLHET